MIGAGSQTYQYDANGNRNASGDVIGPDNQLLSDGTWDYSYDADGNEVGKVDIATGVSWSYGYDDANQMTSATEYAAGGKSILAQVAYTYDVFGDRLQQSIYTASTGTTTEQRYGYDGQNVWVDLNSSNQLETHYLYGDAVDQILARVSSAGVVAWYLTDHLGSVRDLMNDSGQIIDHRDYDAFGNIVTETNPAAGDQYGFTGREFDITTGLQYNRARYYDLSIGRWTSQDPMGFNAGDTNLYRYVNNHTTSETDPSGYNWFTDGLKKVDQALGVAGNWVLTGGDVIGMQDASLSQLASDFGTGANDGAAVYSSTLALGYVGKDRAQRVQLEAQKRGDVISQIGFGGAKAGAHTTQAVGIIVTGGALAPALEGTAVATVLSSPAGVATAQSLSATFTVYSATNAINNFAEGNITDGIDNSVSALGGFKGTQELLQPKLIVPATFPNAPNTSMNWTIPINEGGAINAVGKAGGVEIEIIANMSRSGNTITLDGLHFTKNLGDKLGPKQLQEFGRDFLRQHGNGATELVINPALRTTGATAGKGMTLKPITINLE